MSRLDEKAFNKCLLQSVLSKMEKRSGKVLSDHIRNYGSVRFFSYGSNLNDEDFTERMIEAAKDHELRLKRKEACLQNAKKCTLNDYKRSLKNKSGTHGAAYTIHQNGKHKIEGICHDITSVALEPFLWKEGVLSTRLIAERKYKLVEEKVVEEKEPVLILIGLKSVHAKNLDSENLQKALKYVKDICIPCTTEMKVDCTDMESTRKYLESIMVKRGLQIE